MKKLILSSKIKINCNKDKPFSGMAFDGEYFYMCYYQLPYIYIFNLNGDFIQYYGTEIPYTSICYDGKEGCFWAIPSLTNNIIYKLSLNFMIIDEIKVRYASSETLNTISFNFNDDTLILTTYKGLYIIKKNGQRVCKYEEGKKRLILTSAVVLRDILCCNIYEASALNIINRIEVIFTHRNKEDIWCIPKGLMVNSICTAYGKNDYVVLFILATKECKESYILKYDTITKANSNNENHILT